MKSIDKKIKNFAEENAKQMENLIILELQKETVEEKNGKIVWTQKARLRMQDREDWKNEIKAKINKITPKDDNGILYVEGKITMATHILALLD